MLSNFHFASVTLMMRFPVMITIALNVLSHTFVSYSSHNIGLFLIFKYTRFVQMHVYFPLLVFKFLKMSHLLILSIIDKTIIASC